MKQMRKEFDVRQRTMEDKIKTLSKLSAKEKAEKERLQKKMMEMAKKKEEEELTDELKRTLLLGKI